MILKPGGGRIMNCVLCKANLTSGRVNHIVDLGEGIIIIKNVPANMGTDGTCNLS